MSCIYSYMSVKLQKHYKENLLQENLDNKSANNDITLEVI